MNPATRTVSILLLAACLSPACRRREPPAQSERPFATIEAAIKAGIVDEGLLTTLRSGTPADAFVILVADPPQLPTTPDTRPEHRMGLLIDRLRKQFGAVKADLRSAHTRMETVRDYDTLPLILVRIARAEDLLQLANDRRVQALTIMHTNTLHLAQTLPLIRATESIAMGQRGAGTSIAIIDSGVLFSNTAFGTCPSVAAPGCRILFSGDSAPDDAMQDDAILHGSTMAQIALAVAPAATIVMFDASRTPGRINDEDSLSALNTIVGMRPTINIQAVSMSFGHKEYWTTECSGSGFVRNPYIYPFLLLRTFGILPVVSVGNDASNNGFQTGVAWPACTVGAMRVGAVYDSAGVTLPFPPPLSCTDPAAVADTVACFSQTGPLVSLFAPGAAMTTPSLRVGAVTSTGSGTSEVAPQVAAAYAVMRAFKAADLTSVQSVLTNSGPNVTDPRVGITRRRLDVAGALITHAGPIPDHFASAQPLAGAAPAAASTTFAATTEPGEPTHAGLSHGASIWFRWVSPFTGQAKVMTFGSDFDTVLAVFTGNAINALVPVVVNDNAGSSQQSMATFQAQAGTRFHIAVAGMATAAAGPARGIVQLTLNGPPPNDSLADAAVLVSGAATTGMNFAAGKQAGEQRHCGNQGGASVWYRWTPSTAGTATVSTSSPTFGNRCVAVYRGPAANPTMAGLVLEKAGQWATPDDTWSATFPANPATTYWIVVEGMSSEEPGFDAPARGSFTIIVR